MQNERKDEPRPRFAACQISNLKFQISEGKRSLVGGTRLCRDDQLRVTSLVGVVRLCRDDGAGEGARTRGAGTARPTLLLRGWGTRTEVEEKAPHVNSTCWAPGPVPCSSGAPDVPHAAGHLRPFGPEALQNPEFLIDSALRFEIAATDTKQRTGHVSNR
jgi:hypothetical protein